MIASDTPEVLSRDWARWTNKEIQVILDHYQRIGPTECQKMLPGRGLDAIRQRASRLGVVRFPAWTPEEDAKLAEWRKRLSVKACARLMPNRTYDAVRHRSEHLARESRK